MYTLRENPEKFQYKLGQEVIITDVGLSELKTGTTGVITGGRMFGQGVGPYEEYSVRTFGGALFMFTASSLKPVKVYEAPKTKFKVGKKNEGCDVRAERNLETAETHNENHVENDKVKIEGPVFQTAMKTGQKQFKFKIGDIVKVVDSHVEGKVIEQKKNSRGLNSYRVQIGNGMEWSYWEEQLELIQRVYEAPKCKFKVSQYQPKFKVGDQIHWKETGRVLKADVIGEIVDITPAGEYEVKVSQGWFRQIWKSKYFYPIGSTFLLDSKMNDSNITLEEIPLPQIPQRKFKVSQTLPQYKIGDKVHYKIMYRTRTQEFIEGDAVIIEVDTSDQANLEGTTEYRIQDINTGKKWYALEKRLTPEYLAPKRKFKIGMQRDAVAYMGPLPDLLGHGTQDLPLRNDPVFVNLYRYRSDRGQAPLSVLEQGVNHPDPTIRCFTTLFSEMPENLAIKLAQDSDGRVRHYVFHNLVDKYPQLYQYLYPSDIGTEDVAIQYNDQRQDDRLQAELLVKILPFYSLRWVGRQEVEKYMLPRYLSFLSEDDKNMLKRSTSDEWNALSREEKLRRQDQSRQAQANVNVWFAKTLQEKIDGVSKLSRDEFRNGIMLFEDMSEGESFHMKTVDYPIWIFALDEKKKVLDKAYMEAKTGTYTSPSGTRTIAETGIDLGEKWDIGDTIDPRAYGQIEYTWIMRDQLRYDLQRQQRAQRIEMKFEVGDEVRLKRDPQSKRVSNVEGIVIDEDESISSTTTIRFTKHFKSDQVGRTTWFYDDELELIPNEHYEIPRRKFKVGQAEPVYGIGEQVEYYDDENQLQKGTVIKSYSLFSTIGTVWIYYVNPNDSSDSVGILQFGEHDLRPALHEYEAPKRKFKISQTKPEYGIGDVVNVKMNSIHNEPMIWTLKIVQIVKRFGKTEYVLQGEGDETIQMSEKYIVGLAYEAPKRKFKISKELTPFKFEIGEQVAFLPGFSFQNQVGKIGTITHRETSALTKENRYVVNTDVEAYWTEEYRLISAEYKAPKRKFKISQQKFKVGDIIKRIDSDRFTPFWRGEIVSIYRDGSAEIRILQCQDRDHIGEVIHFSPRELLEESELAHDSLYQAPKRKFKISQHGYKQGDIVIADAYSSIMSHQGKYGTYRVELVTLKDRTFWGTEVWHAKILGTLEGRELGSDYIYVAERDIVNTYEAPKVKFKISQREYKAGDIVIAKVYSSTIGQEGYYGTYRVELVIEKDEILWVGMKVWDVKVLETLDGQKLNGYVYAAERDFTPANLYQAPKVKFKISGKNRKADIISRIAYKNYEIHEVTSTSSYQPLQHYYLVIKKDSYLYETEEVYEGSAKPYRHFRDEDEAKKYIDSLTFEPPHTKFKIGQREFQVGDEVSFTGIPNSHGVLHSNTSGTGVVEEDVYSNQPGVRVKTCEDPKVIGIVFWIFKEDMTLLPKLLAPKMKFKISQRQFKVGDEVSFEFIYGEPDGEYQEIPARGVITEQGTRFENPAALFYIRVTDMDSHREFIGQEVVKEADEMTLESEQIKYEAPKVKFKIGTVYTNDQRFVWDLSQQLTNNRDPKLLDEWIKVRLSGLLSLHSDVETLRTELINYAQTNLPQNNNKKLVLDRIKLVFDELLKNSQDVNLSVEDRPIQNIADSVIKSTVSAVCHDPNTVTKRESSVSNDSNILNHKEELGNTERQEEKNEVRKEDNN